MNATVTPSKAHVRHEALEFGGEVASLVPAYATGDELRATMTDPVKRLQIAAALEKIMFPLKLPTALIATPAGKVEVALLANVVFEKSTKLAVGTPFDETLPDHPRALGSPQTDDWRRSAHTGENRVED